MVEVELKFQIPEARRTALLKALDPKKSEQIQLKAKYFDTPDRKMAQQHAALRQRLEGTRWIQTLKAAGKSHIERFEHNLDLGELEQAPDLDLIGLCNMSQKLRPFLKTHFRGASKISYNCNLKRIFYRTYRVIEFEDAEIEVSLDVGCIRTATVQKQRYMKLNLSLKSGSIQSLLAFSFEWVKKYQFWLDVRSKAEIGNLLALIKR